MNAKRLKTDTRAQLQKKLRKLTENGREHSIMAGYIRNRLRTS